MRFPSHVFLLALIAAASFCVPGQAQQLRWESKEMTFNPTANDSEVIAHFKFQNTGKVAVKIKSATSSCSCTILKFEKKEYAPDESGEITATFTIGSRTGFQEKSILVESNDSVHPKMALIMKVTIPEVVQIRPTFLYWQAGESLASKEMGVKILNGFPVKTITVESSSLKVAAKVESVKQGEEYRIVVTPSETDHPTTALLSIKMDYPPEKPKSFFATVRVLPKK